MASSIIAILISGGLFAKLVYDAYRKGYRPMGATKGKFWNAVWVDVLGAIPSVGKTLPTYAAI